MITTTPSSHRRADWPNAWFPDTSLRRFSSGVIAAARPDEDG
jgi:hypothetical protein